MLDIRTRRTNNILMLASSLTVLVSLTCSTLDAFAAPPKVLTAEELKQQQVRYLQYVRAVRIQAQRQSKRVCSKSSSASDKNSSKSNNKSSSLHKILIAPKPTKIKLSNQKTPIPRQDVLLVMPAKGAKPEGIKEAIENAGGEICGGLGAGGLRVVLVKARPGKVVELQRKLAADTSEFLHVDFNRPIAADFIPKGEPTFSKSWHLTQMHVPDAWTILFQHTNFPMPVAVFDSGVQGAEPFTCFQGADCTGKVGNDKVDDLNLDGFLGTGIGADSVKEKEGHIAQIGNNIKTLTYGCIDPVGHGTWVACTITGQPYNGLGSVGVNPMVPVYPIRIANGPAGGPAKADDLSIYQGDVCDV